MVGLCCSRKRPWGLLGMGWSTKLDSKDFGAGKTELELELLEEVDFRDGCGWP